ncbi:PAS domain-containing protein [Vreelandella janggokensis]|uniref:PAS domain-containing protein n=1 Tax=Vreelandella janggokensis TaxID=370767 RepID=UPI0028592249|nr:PAS domain-containing protein [Halomonas janggokensis]MDR5885333.1 PAS domain-containing protein [Halomonas janggokensis]
MKVPPIPDNESDRQSALNKTGLLDGVSEARFDRITRLARHVFSVPIALVSLVDGDRQWFKSCQGLGVDETPREFSFCAHAILSQSPLIIENALDDARFADNPLVLDEPNIRFYAGAPLHTADGYRIGTLCLIDTRPRTLSADQVGMLVDLAATVEALIQADEISQTSYSALESELMASRDHMASLINNMPGVTYRCLHDEQWTMLYISGQVDRVSGYQAADLIGNQNVCYADLIHPDDAPALEKAVQAAITNNVGWHLEYRIRHRDGSWRWVEERGQSVPGDVAHPVVLEGFIVDITREQNTLSQLKKHHDALVLLNDIVFSSQETLDGKINHALATARQYLQVDLAILSQIEGNIYTVRWMEAAPGASLSPGQQFMLGQTWCQFIFSGRADEERELFVANVEQSEFKRHPCYRENPLGAYIGIAIDIEGQPFGTLNFSASNPRACDYDDSEKLFIRLLARWLSDLLANNLHNERLSKLTAQLPGVTYQFRRFADGRIIFPFSSPQIEDFYGLTPAQAAEDATPAFARIHPDDLSAIQASIEHSSDTLEYWTAMYRVQFEGVGYRWIMGHAKPERLVDGSTLWHGYLHDIHEWEQARQALENNEARLRGLFDFSPIGIALNDFATGRFIDLNDALIAPTGYTRDEFVSLSYWDVTPKEYEPAEDQALATLKATGRYGPFEKEYIRKDGSRYPVRLQGMLSQEQDGRQVIWSLVEDITERRKLDKMKDQFISTVSHELRTPLTSIKGSLGLVKGGAAGDLPDQAQSLINTAERNAQRLAALINDLLDMEKLVAGKMPMNLTVQPLAPLLKDVVDSLQGYSDQHQVAIQGADAWPSVCCQVDGPRLIQALTNLLSNAIKFSPPGQTVALVVTATEHTVEISVRDHGPGVAPAFRDRLFQRFAQADSSDTRKLPGTGLGLAISQEICQQMGGEVGYRDAVGGGADFFIVLPREHTL